MGEYDHGFMLNRLYVYISFRYLDRIKILFAYISFAFLSPYRNSLERSLRVSAWVVSRYDAISLDLNSTGTLRSTISSRKPKTLRLIHTDLIFLRDTEQSFKASIPSSLANTISDFLIND